MSDLKNQWSELCMYKKLFIQSPSFEPRIPSMVWENNVTDVLLRQS